MIIEIIGFLAGALTTAAFIPQVVKTAKSRKTEDISLTMYIIFNSGVLLWLIYGIFITSLPIILANAVTLALGLTILFFKIKFK